jgi:hypothetical protein
MTHPDGISTELHHNNLPTPSSRKSSPFFQQFLTPLLLGLVCFLVYNANLRQIGAGDTLPARYQPLIFWHEATLNLDGNAPLIAHGHSIIENWNRPAGADGNVTYFEPWAYWIISTRQHQLASLYPMVTPLLVSPLYLPANIWLNAHDWNPPQVDWVAILMEKLSASFLAAVASVLVYLILKREGNQWALPLTIVFAFGTNTWMISSQALWQHGTGEVLIALALLLAIVRPSPARISLLGAVCVLMVANRPPDALIAGAIGLFIVWKRWRNAGWLLMGAAIPLGVLLYYNLNFIGKIAGAYSLVRPPQSFFQPIWSGVLGLLVSPTRGLLVFSPFLIFIPIGLIQRLRSSNSQKLAVMLGLAVVAQILFYSQADWRAGASWGPRWLTDLLPILIWMLASTPLVLRPFARILLILTMVASVGVQVIGAFWYTKTSDELIFVGNPASMNAAWDIRNIPFLTELRHPPARGELLCNVNGSIDRIGAVLLPSTEKLPDLNSRAVVEGWALACGRTPAQVLLLVDGIVIGSTTGFVPREDVNTAMHTASPSAWHVSANMLGVPPGERVLQLAVRIEPRSDIRIIREQRVFVIAQEASKESVVLPQKIVSDPELEAMAKQAIQLLHERQSVYGYWLTSYTNGLRYEAPRQEMNTFLTSMLVDLLSPIAHQQNLDDMMEHAQQHLVAQIESNGLVRYHGLPDGPTIGKLGCVITPDADDTALVWRIAAKSADPKAQTMLAELARYRDARGFYRTWLAPQTQYRCIDPGNDPNPTDVGIQMHMYLMLREFDPPAAQNLCDALQRSFWDRDIWVYYSKAPLVPYLRSTELRQLGCAIPLPTERLALPAAGQEIWSEAARQLANAMALAPDKDTRQAIRDLLVRLGSDDFAQLRNSPPMLYHNDLSATVSRYYWSEDFGYALWLRLYAIVGVETGPLQQLSP